MTTRRMRARTTVLGTVIVLTSALGLAGCSKDDSTSTDVATTEAAATEAAATEAVASEALETEAVDTEAAAATEAMASEAGDTEAMASDAAAVGGDALKATLIGEMMKGMNGGAPADQADIDCVSGKVTEKDISAMMSAGAGAGGLPPEGVAVMKAFFGCKPKALMDSFVKSSFNDMPAEVTEDQKSCMANKFFDFIANDDDTLSAIVSDASKPPAKFKSEGAKIVKECVPAGAAQDKLIAEITKDS